MSDVTVRYREWLPGSHRNHRAGAGPDLHEPDGARGTWVSLEARELDYDFRFWTATHTVDGGAYLPPGVTTGQFAFPAGEAPAEMDAWYTRRDNGPEPPGPPGIVFDAFSLAAGEFLDWGDLVDPFSVTPAGAREDDLARTDGGAASVTAIGAWPRPELLVNAPWVVFGDANSLGPEVFAEHGRSAFAIALYATPVPVRPPHRPVPVWTHEEAVLGELTRELVQAGSLRDLAAALPDRVRALPIERAALAYLGERAAEELKRLDGQQE